MRRRPRGERGQAALELVGLLPLVAIVLFAGMQIFTVVFAASQANAAARAGARVASRGGAGAAEARSSLSGSSLGRDAKVDQAGTRVTVRVRVPLALPGSPVEIATVTRSAELPPT